MGEEEQGPLSSKKSLSPDIVRDLDLDASARVSLAHSRAAVAETLDRSTRYGSKDRCVNDHRSRMPYTHFQAHLLDRLLDVGGKCFVMAKSTGNGQYPPTCTRSHIIYSLCSTTISVCALACILMMSVRSLG